MLDSYIKRIVIHQFSPNDTELLLSDRLVSITPRIDEYFRKKLAKVFSDEAKRGQFEANNTFLQPLVMICWKRLLPLPSYGRKPLLFQRIKNQ